MAQETKTPEEVQGRAAWLNTRTDGLPVKSWIAIGVTIAVVVLGFGAWWTYGLGRGTGMDGQMDDMATDAPRFPPVTGFYAGEQVFFIHTEASDPEVAEMLTDMMESPVLTVPELARVPRPALGAVYVFTNGVQPDGPRGPTGFQPDVFDTAPGDPGYSPLREVNLVTWRDGVEPRKLTSADDIDQARDQGDVQVTPSGAVVNMPFLQWPGGGR